MPRHTCESFTVNEVAPVSILLSEELEGCVTKFCITFKEAEPPAYITVNQERIGITANLGRAIESLCYHVQRESQRGPFYLWVDAL